MTSSANCDFSAEAGTFGPSVASYQFGHFGLGMRSGVKSKHESYRKILEKKAEEIQQSMSAQKAAQVLAREEHPHDEGDLSQQSHEEWIFLNRNTLDITLLREVQAALRRIARGTYGVCSECEEPISVKRLAAVPWARFCVSCQERIASGAPMESEERFQEAQRGAPSRAATQDRNSADEAARDAPFCASSPRAEP